MDSELLGDALYGDSRQPALDEKCADAARAAATRAKHAHDDAGTTTAGAPLLASAQNVAVGSALRRRSQRRGIGSGVRLGERETGDHVAGCEPLQPALFLPGVAQGENR